MNRYSDEPRDCVPCGIEFAPGAHPYLIFVRPGRADDYMCPVCTFDILNAAEAALAAIAADAPV